ncbi:MAG: hypothetical protein Ta2B_09690 [Termitinemataceae bacterium]|nr:MAG: hypothetical protein Ta2B_09690 [Termitinemataceae bacterium]
MSLKSTIVDAYSRILECVLWLVIVGCAVAGYYIENDVMYIDGWFWGVALGALGGFIIDAVIFGSLALILDIRDTLKSIDTKLTPKV